MPPLSNLAQTLPARLSPTSGTEVPTRRTRSKAPKPEKAQTLPRPTSVEVIRPTTNIVKVLSRPILY
ncbi:hypothetical protein BGY98DRAFT_1016244 [Russula aff. rugulosa BPL654]|nr:hypothetical protein BGY98DRAFT_1035062 [Russula aff. rugulosa BPL654]KAI0269050.1 hypothetical protein BGY98DRAFT_1016244 [Russula aff. rugulosa BPL654]